MTNHISILSRTLTAEFYRANAMFFLVATGFCFGFMRGAEHMALAGFFVSSPWLIMVPVCVWIVYSIKVVAYNKRETGFERNRFLYVMPLANGGARISGCMSVAIGQMGPGIAYGSFLAAVAARNSQSIVLVIIVIALVTLTIIPAYMLDRALTYPAKEESTPRPIRRLDQLFAKPMAWMFTEGIVRSQPGLIYTTKFAACVVIYAATQLYLFDEYDERLYLMAACIAFSANLSLVYQYQRFEVVDLLMLRSLPIPFTKRIITFVITMIALCFPEIAMLATNLPKYIPVHNYFGAMVFGLSLFVCGYGALYVRDATFDAFTRWIFFVSMGLVLLILFGMPVWIAAIGLSAIGIHLLRRHYYSFELIT